MRLDELTRPPWMDDAKAILVQAGYRQIGWGSFSKVFWKPGKQYVLKLFEPNDEAYLAFVALVHSNPNPHFPKFYGKPVRITQHYYGLRMELLREEDQEWPWKLIKDYAVHGNASQRQLTRNSWMRKDYLRGKRFLEGQPQLKQAVDLIVELARERNFDIDIARRNVMRRGDVLVLIDPLFPL